MCPKKANDGSGDVEVAGQLSERLQSFCDSYEGGLWVIFDENLARKLCQWWHCVAG